MNVYSRLLQQVYGTNSDVGLSSNNINDTTISFVSLVTIFEKEIKINKNKNGIVKFMLLWAEERMDWYYEEQPNMQERSIPYLYLIRL